MKYLLLPLLSCSLILLGSCSSSSVESFQFSDNDGDLVSDTPTDPSQLIDPSSLIFAYTPVEDPAVYADVWAGFIEHLSELTGKEVKFFPVQSNAAQLEAMRAGRLHVTGFNTGSVPAAVNLCGFVPAIMMAATDGSFGYEMEIIVPRDSSIDKPEAIRGRQLAFTSPTSNSGHKAPSVLLQTQFGLESGKDYTPVFSGKHDNSILGVVNGDYEAAAVANSVLDRMVDRGVVQPDSYRSIFKSATFPTTAFGYAYNLKPELAGKIKEAFATYPWEGSKLAEEFGKSGEAQFIPITYKEHWAVIREIDEANGVVYEIR
ncbi:MAG: phosphate/phosphite/phosphonate ABC transporter substrate-binding protein [Verrucomicrobiales bacterium]|nr:phosphate/phosphite/phosphonate ABC transporter substrate-binding protein [Verrucomicrobiales bacterium]